MENRLPHGEAGQRSSSATAEYMGWGGGGFGGFAVDIAGLLLSCWSLVYYITSNVYVLVAN